MANDYLDAAAISYPRSSTSDPLSGRLAGLYFSAEHPPTLPNYFWIVMSWMVLVPAYNLVCKDWLKSQSRHKAA